MLTPTWINLATQVLNRLESTRVCKVAVMGIGHEMNGDDAVGVIVANSLSQKLSMAINTDYTTSRMIIAAGPAPENFCGQLRRFLPDLVIIIDAAHIDSKPGWVEWLPWQQTTGMSASTHSLPLSMLSQYLVNEIGCEIFLIAIQAGANDFEEQLSPEVSRAKREVVHGLESLLFPRV